MTVLHWIVGILLLISALVMIVTVLFAKQRAQRFWAP